MERLWFVLGVGGGERVHDCKDQQAGYIQVQFFRLYFSSIFHGKELIFIKFLYFRSANQILRFALEGRLSLVFEPPDYNQVCTKDF